MRPYMIPFPTFLSKSNGFTKDMLMILSRPLKIKYKEYTFNLSGVIFIFLFCIISSCTSKKNIIKYIPDKTDKEIFDAITQHNIDFQWASYKAKAKIDTPDEKTSGTILLRMRQDSIIWAAIKKLGIEAARLQVDSLQYTILYRFEDVYEQNSLHNLGHLFSIDASFYDIQNMLIGNVLHPSNGEYTVFQTEKDIQLTSYVTPYTIHYILDKASLLLTSYTITDKKENTYRLLFDDYKLTEQQYMRSHKIDITFPVEGQNTGNILLELSDIEINIPKNMPFKIPENYEKLINY